MSADLLPLTVPKARRLHFTAGLAAIAFHRTGVALVRTALKHEARGKGGVFQDAHCRLLT